ncbi:DUF6722 family protein [uncultured Parabacteroides sp.]|uniref:DUF6722 family protein n=1 Tax=uncultured Parabacteroides sp. TaxID=512312 RepID=UPI00259B5898|nr:DUF6722 family protein [uncultured Parabacteroides sp.]
MKNEDMLKELGKYFIDISKYIATTVLISTFLSGSKNTMFLAFTALLAAMLFLVWGLMCLSNNDKKKQNGR